MMISSFSTLSWIRPLSFAVGAAALLWGCADEERRTGYLAPRPVTTAPSSGDGGGTTTSSSNSSTTGGGATGTGGGDTTPLPAQACAGERAFRAAGMVFTEPTPPSLAAALGELLFGYDAHALTVVLRGDDSEPTVTVGGTTASDQGLHRFVSTEVTAGPAEWRGLGFAATTPLEFGNLRWEVPAEADGQLMLRNITFEARADEACSEVWLVMDAVIPAEEAQVLLPLATGAATVEEVAGPLPGGDQVPGLGWSVRAMFQAEAISFDFEGSP